MTLSRSSLNASPAKIGQIACVGKAYFRKLHHLMILTVKFAI